MAKQLSQSIRDPSFMEFLTSSKQGFTRAMYQADSNQSTYTGAVEVLLEGFKQQQEYLKRIETISVDTSLPAADRVVKILGIIAEMKGLLDAAQNDIST